MAKVYVSAHHPDLANALATQLAAAGHTISSTWHTETGLRPAADDAAAWATKAGVNVTQIGNSDVLVLISSPEHVTGVKRVQGGKFVEAGVALGRMVRVFVLGQPENGMLHHPRIEVVADADELVRKLDRW